MLDADHFIQKIEENKEGLYRIARGYFSNPADLEDAISETILSAWAARGQLRQERYFRTWFIRILINQCNDIRKRVGTEIPLEAVPEPAAPEQEEPFLFTLLDQLDESTRLILLLHYDQGYQTRQIARMLSIPHGTVASKMKRGREKLAKRLQEEGYK